MDMPAPAVPEAVARGKVNISLAYASQFVMTIAAGEPVTLLAGVMVGCFELFGNEASMGSMCCWIGLAWAAI